MITVLRHAATVFNAQGRTNGRLDDPLADGVRDRISDELDSVLGRVDFAVAYSSPLQRAVQTAEALLDGSSTRLVIDPRLCEVDYGNLSGLDEEQFRTAVGHDSVALLDTYDYDLRPFGGESARDVQARVVSFIAERLVGVDHDALVVTHGGVIRWFYGLLAGMRSSWVPNLSVHQFDTPDSFELVSLELQ